MRQRYPRNESVHTDDRHDETCHPDLASASRSGVAPAFISRLHLVTGASPDKKKKYKGLKALFVTDFGTGEVEILKNGTYASDGTISDGLDGPDGDWIDSKGNFYVANYAGPNIQEYKPKGSSPSFTYSASITDAVGVSTDSEGNVYEADYNDGGEGYVNEYKQGSNTVAATCSPGGSVEGVAIDKSGDVFVDFNNPNTGHANIVEYKGGLSGCNGTTLGVTLGFAGGLVLDSKNDIVVCDQTGPSVDVIAPPYSSVTRTLGSGYSDPFHVTLSAKNKLAFVAVNGAAVVDVIDYSTGSITQTLNSANGLSDPASAVDGPNDIQ